MKPIAWYDPSNGAVSTDKDCPLFTPLGQVWPLQPEREWVWLTDEDLVDCESEEDVRFARRIEAKSKELNT